MIAVLATVLLADTGNQLAETKLQSSLVSFAAEQIGKTIGSGECAELAAEALEKAEAKPFGTWEDAPSTGDYVWGVQVATLTPGKTDLNLKPGDILQFRDVKIVTKSGYMTTTYTASQHTAIIETLNTETGEVKVLHQNSRGRKYVTRDSISLKDIKGGTIRAYRAQPK